MSMLRGFRNALLGVVVLGTVACKGASTTAEPSKDDARRAAKLEIVRAWSGRIHLPMAEPGGEVVVPAPMFVRDAARYAELVALIPEKQIQKKQPAPPSDDPLLQKPEVDFEKHMIVAVFRADTMYVHPKLSNPRRKDGALVLDLEHPPLGETAHAAARADIGTYAAVLVSRADEVKLVEK